ncbi:bifunctional DNA primase/polymerase [Streptomyces yaizuensis]|uniref:Bifunctional DNA primase/polymerase n=1 Tax=Streptomyces yaizuensis TaxID=2989713 RepID=A0ABQ5P3W0_9ACTN|nr:bifunctional DNA primase/polymerase [Streptomyces sp. YSPA8]GLF97291.1 bifunctional DNA primase/polymerase [Streptomyces sp. YSPA8]
MEETIGVEKTNGATEAARIPRQRGGQLLDHAVQYTEERHWDVFPGTWLEAGDGKEHCSCGDAGCELPGAHADGPDWASQATGSATAARRMWGKHPKASILMPTGRTFDVLDLPESAGFLALARLERMELPLGPVSCTPDRRMLFFVLPGATAKVPDLIRGLGWSPSALDLVTRGEGHYVAAPPTRVGGRGAVQWVRRPTDTNRWLPDAEELINPLAYACGRDAAEARTRGV